MLHKLTLYTLLLCFFSCNNLSDKDSLLDIALDNQFSIHSSGCSFNTSELLFDTTKSVLNNSCSERAEHRLNSIIGEQIKKRIYLQGGDSFIDSLNVKGFKQYLGENLLVVKELHESYLYSNSNMFKKVEVIERENLFMDWDFRHACLIEITDTYYSADKKKAALGLLNYCGHSEVYLIYYFINIKGTWLINFVEVGD